MPGFNRYLRGFLSLLDGKVGGQTPAEYLPELRVTLDAFPFVFAQLRELIPGNTGAIGTGAEGFAGDISGNLTVPSDELWYCENFTVRPTTILGAAEALVAVPASQARVSITGNLGVSVWANVALLGSSSFSTTPAYGATRPFVALPGDLLGAWVNHIVTAATLDLVLMVSAVRMKV